MKLKFGPLLACAAVCLAVVTTSASAGYNAMVPLGTAVLIPKGISGTTDGAVTVIVSNLSAVGGKYTLSFPKSLTGFPKSLKLVKYSAYLDLPKPGKPLRLSLRSRHYWTGPAGCVGIETFMRGKVLGSMIETTTCSGGQPVPLSITASTTREVSGPTMPLVLRVTNYGDSSSGVYRLHISQYMRVLSHPGLTFESGSVQYMKSTPPLPYPKPGPRNTKTFRLVVATEPDVRPYGAMLTLGPVVRHVNGALFSPPYTMSQITPDLLK
jgi:hypothetical protein